MMRSNSVLTQQPPELMEKWLSMIPGGRICDPAELKSVSCLETYLDSLFSYLFNDRPMSSWPVTPVAT